jgi:hypothetical protein
MGARRVRKQAIWLAAVVAAALPAGVAGAASAAGVAVAVDRESPLGKSRLALGATHTQHSLDRWGDPLAVLRGRRLLATAVRYQNQAIYGWGAGNPNPAPGVYDWHTLDRRMQLIRSTGGTPVITLCCAPDWMTALGTRSTEYPNLPPTAGHHRHFADLARRVARRYPDVKHYMVWNEMKGFWDRARNNWDFVSYTRMYNAVHEALKSVDPSIRVGGPYLVIEGTGSRSLGKTGYATAEPITDRDREVLEYWLEHKRGADFLAVDRKTISGSHDHNTYSAAEQMSLTRWFGVVTRKLRRMTKLPVWYAEDYFVGSDDWAFQAAGIASMLGHHVRSGASASFRWGPQGQDGGPFGGNKQSLVSDTRAAGGGRPYPAHAVYAAFRRHFRRGARLYPAVSTAPDVEALASARATLLINKRDARVRVAVGRRTVTLERYEVRLLRP